MAAATYSPAHIEAAPAIPAPMELGLDPQVPARQHLWRGASGRVYVHRVYTLIECPPLPQASYVLVRREADGRRIALHVGLGRSGTATLNLAQVRRRGAQLGANEVHVHFPRSAHADAGLVACDLRAGQFRSLAGEPHGVAA
jgi:hypothetical protein